MLIFARAHCLHSLWKPLTPRPAQGSSVPHPTRLQGWTGLGGPESKAIAEQEGERELPISSLEVPLELKAKVFCDFSLWSLTGHLPKPRGESSHSNTEILLSMHLQQKRMFSLSRHHWTPVFIFQQYLHKKCCSFHCKTGRNGTRRGNRL